MRLLSLISPVSYYVYFRRRALLRRFRRIGSNFLFDPLSTILTPENIEIGDNVFIGERAHISAEVQIGNNVMFGPRPMLIGGDHYFAVRGKSVRFMHPQGRENIEPIHIEDEAWFGAGVIILGNVTAGMGCVVGAGSLVAKSIPPYTVAVGNPCRPVKRIFNDATLKEHLILIGINEDRALGIITRRQSELTTWGCADLPIIDKTDSYWETRTNK